jgi:hypothetical protein
VLPTGVLYFALDNLFMAVVTKPEPDESAVVSEGQSALALGEKARDRPASENRVFVV